MGISILAWLSSRDQYGSRDDNQANMEMPMYQTIYYLLPTSRKETPILAWDEVEAHIGPRQYGPRYGNDLVVIQKPVIFPRCENMDSLLPVILVIQNAFIWTKYVIITYIYLQVRILNSMYYLFIKEWLDVFPREQFIFIKMEDYVKYKEETLNRIFKFLGLCK